MNVFVGDYVNKNTIIQSSMSRVMFRCFRIVNNFDLTIVGYQFFELENKRFMVK